MKIIKNQTNLLDIIASEVLSIEHNVNLIDNQLSNNMLECACYPTIKVGTIEYDLFVHNAIIFIPITTNLVEFGQMLTDKLNCLENTNSITKQLYEHSVLKNKHFNRNNTTNILDLQCSKSIILACKKYTMYQDKVKNIDIQPSTRHNKYFCCTIAYQSYLHDWSPSQRLTHNDIIFQAASLFVDLEDIIDLPHNTIVYDFESQYLKSKSVILYPKDDYIVLLRNGPAFAIMQSQYWYYRYKTGDLPILYNIPSSRLIDSQTIDHKIVQTAIKTKQICIICKSIIYGPFYIALSNVHNQHVILCNICPHTLNPFGVPYIRNFGKLASIMDGKQELTASMAEFPYLQTTKIEFGKLDHIEYANIGDDIIAVNDPLYIIYTKYSKNILFEGKKIIKAQFV